MIVLLDTNILARIVDPGQPMYSVALRAIGTLRAQGHDLVLVPQCLYEFWVVGTRPKGKNGLGKSVAEMATDLANLRLAFPMFDDTPTIFPAWQTFVQSYAVTGKTAHDARLVAAMHVHGITHLLTFNDKDFRRFSTITVLTPAAVLANPSVP